MSKMIVASIDLTKIDQSRVITGKKGKYVNLTIWLNDKNDNYGNDVSIEQRVEKGQPKIYLGNGKTFSKKEQAAPENLEGQFQKNGQASNDLDWMK